MENETKTVDFSELERVLPPIVFRNWRGWRDVLPIAPRTCANEDSKGTGPKVPPPIFNEPILLFQWTK